MALISKIRNNSWLLVVLLALGLGGFVLMDMVSGQQSVFGSGRTRLADIDGRKVDVNEFNRVDQILYGNSGADVYARRDYLFNFYVEETLLQEEAEEIGLGVSKEELVDLQFGVNLSPIIQQRFVNPNTGQVDRNILNQYRTAIQNGTLDPQLRQFWAIQEKEIITDALKRKLTTMLTKAVYTPNWLLEMMGQEQAQKVDFAYVQVPYDVVDNSEVALTDEDFENYLEAHKAKYWQDEETRRVAYVAFDVVPTPEDSASLRKTIEDLIPAFAETEDDSLFVENNYGYIETNVKKEQLPPVIADTVFVAPVGSVIGPYIDQGEYRAVKILDRKVIPDSVRARHILKRVSAPEQVAQAQRTIDSLKNLIETGQAIFDSLAVAFSDDPSNAGKGGDLGWFGEGMMVKPFNDACFFEGEPGKLMVVYTQFGIHLVEVTDRKFINNTEAVKLAYITQPIVPSEATQSRVRNEALDFVEKFPTLEELRAALAERPDLTLEVSPPLTANDYSVGALGSGPAAREIVRWAFGYDPNTGEPDVGDVSPNIYTFQPEGAYYVDKFVVAALQAVQEPGLPSVDYIRDEIEPLVLNEKKGALISEQIKGKELEAIAAQYELSVDTARNVNFGSSVISGIGSEPRVLGWAFVLDQGQQSDPIAGNNGVYVIEVTFKPAPTPPANLAIFRQTAALSARSQIQARVMDALKELADIEDYRARFF